MDPQHFLQDRLSAVSVNKLSEPFAMSLPAISKHLKVLERAGLITRGREAQWRPCALKAGPLKEVVDWTAHYRRFYEVNRKKPTPTQGEEKWPPKILN